jgi:hypothetical protein
MSRSRSAGFFGLHFDFHCQPNAKRVGGRTTPAMVRAVLSQVRPDYVQIDCKGHPGISSYPTRVGIPAADIARDQLAVWHKVTRAAGVPLVMHYSGVQDAAAIKRHPAWARINQDGKPDGYATSVFSPYADKLMIPQLIELARVRRVDAVWVDGDCWSAGLDWSRWSLAAWRRSTGRKRLPTGPEDPDWLAFLDHCREGFRVYLRRYVDALHAACPGFEIASNWAFSSFMPEPVWAAVDFISGDFAACQSVQSARLQGRCLMHQGRPWDLMAWGFGWHGDNALMEKSAIQLCQEAAMVLSLGGGFQLYTTQQSDGFVAPGRLPVLAEVARFCRDRQALCHRAEPVGGIAVLYSHEDWRRRSGALFPCNSPVVQPVEGALRLCLDARRHTEVIFDHQLADRLDACRVVVLPDCHHLASEVRDPLVDWLRRGGRILALGPHALAALNLKDLPIRPDGDIAETVRHLRSPDLAGGAEFAVQKCDWQEWKTGASARILTKAYASGDVSGPAWPGAVSCRIGRGRLVAVAGGIARSYLERTSSVTTALVAAWLRHLDPRPLVEVEGPGRVEVACMRKDGELRVHLTNLEGPHEARQIMAWDRIPPLGPLTVRLRVPGRGPVRWEPDGVRLRSRRTADGMVIEVPGVAIHGALCLLWSAAQPS